LFFEILGTGIAATVPPQWGHNYTVFNRAVKERFHAHFYPLI